MDIQPSIFSSEPSWDMPEKESKKYKKCIQDLATVITRIERDGRVSPYLKGALTKCSKMAEAQGFTDLAKKITLLRDKYSTIGGDAVRENAHHDKELINEALGTTTPGPKEKPAVKKREREEVPPQADQIQNYRQEQKEQFYAPVERMKRVATKAGKLAANGAQSLWATTKMLAPSKRALLIATPASLAKHSFTLLQESVIDPWETLGVLIRVAQDAFVGAVILEQAQSAAAKLANTSTEKPAENPLKRHNFMTL